MNKIPKGWVYIPDLFRLIRESWQRGRKVYENKFFVNNDHGYILIHLCLIKYILLDYIVNFGDLCTVLFINSKVYNLVTLLCIFYV